MNKSRVNQGHGARFQATQPSHTWEAYLPQATPIYHVTVWQQPTFAEAEIPAPPSSMEGGIC